MKVELTETPVDLYIETGLAGRVDVQNISAFPIRILAGDEGTTDPGEYNKLMPGDWLPFEDTTLFACIKRNEGAPGSLVRVNQQ